MIGHRGEVKGMGVAVRGFLFGNGFWLSHSCFNSWFNSSFYLLRLWIVSLAGQKRGTPPLVCFKRPTQTSGHVRKVKFRFDLLYFQIKVLVLFEHVPRRLPSAASNRGWYGCIFPWVECIILYKSQRHMFSYCTALCTVFSSTHDTGYVWPTALLCCNTCFCIGCEFMFWYCKFTRADVCIVWLWLLCTGRCVLVDVLYVVNLRKPMGQIALLRKLWSAEYVLVRACFLLSIFIITVIVFCYALLSLIIQLFLLCYLYCVAVELIIPHKIRLFEFRRLKGPRDISCEPSDRHLMTLPLWLATWGFNTVRSNVSNYSRILKLM